jgi:hypothetical protein
MKDTVIITGKNAVERTEFMAQVLLNLYHETL